MKTYKGIDYEFKHAIGHRHKIAFYKNGKLVYQTTPLSDADIHPLTLDESAKTLINNLVLKIIEHNKSLNPRRKRKRKNPRFDKPTRASKEKWYAILAYNGTYMLARQVIPFDRKSKATNFARDLVGKLYKGKEVTSVVLEGPFKTMLQASNVVVVLPPPNI